MGILTLASRGCVRTVRLSCTSTGSSSTSVLQRHLHSRPLATAILQSLRNYNNIDAIFRKSAVGVNCIQRRCYSPQAQRKPQGSSSLAESKDRPAGEITVGAKVARAGKDAAYGSVVVVGIGVTLIMFYAIGRELLSGNSESGLYGRAFKIVKKNDDIYVAMGHPLKAYGETNRRGRRRHVQAVDFLDNEGVKHTRMKFYIEGPSGKAEVHLEAKHEYGGSEFRYIFVDAPNQRKPIIVLDNR